jgi:DnaJ-class molecular chaperone
MAEPLKIVAYTEMRWVNCEVCGGSGEIVRRAPYSHAYAEPVEYSELCEECGGTGRDCALWRDETLN